MKNRYNEMHESVLKICAQNDIEILQGKLRPADGSGKTAYGKTDLLVSAENLQKLYDACKAGLDQKNYKIELKSTKKGKVCSIFRTDMTATTIFKVMKKQPVSHYPQITVRAAGDDAAENKAGFTGYTLVGDSYLPEEFIEEAKRRGYLSEERLARYQEHRAWRKENRVEIDKKYKEYQEVLLGLKQP